MSSKLGPNWAKATLKANASKSGNREVAIFFLDSPLYVVRLSGLSFQKEAKKKEKKPLLRFEPPVQYISTNTSLPDVDKE